MTDSETTPTDEISLLDIAVVIAENWLVLVIAPLLAGLIAYGILSVTTPRVYDSEALVQMNSTDAALLRSARVLNPAILNSTYLDGYAGSLSRARQQLVDNVLEVGAEGDTGLYRIRTSFDSPEEARDLLQRIINSLIANSTPTTTEAELLDIRLQQARTAIVELEESLGRLNRLTEELENGTALNSATLGELGQSIVTLVDNIERRHAEVFQLQESLQGSISSQHVVQEPTLPDSPRSRGLLMRAILIILGVGFVTLIAVFIREGLRSASRNAGQADKINRIRRAFWLKPIGGR
ncbi:Wzz/FepE/Etk N-terminal domain-containing protein [Pelagibacterium sp.]|uniref:Wzz/FepE/Etk N-terminal domain-containing protein n=1 Tax=Pelagibacterium sp. TaxID=1967288 RepID=UPI003BA9BF36